MPAIPPIAWMLTTPPAPAAASASSASSCRRPVNEAMSRGSVRVAAATPLAAGPARHRMAPRGSLELDAGRAVQPQRIGEQPHRVLVRGGGQAPLQVADRPRAHPRRLGQLLLRQPGPGTQPPQHAGEPSRRLSHGLSSCPGTAQSRLTIRRRPGAVCGQHQPDARLRPARAALARRTGPKAAPVSRLSPRTPLTVSGLSVPWAVLHVPGSGRVVWLRANISAVNPRWRDHVH